jgi:hypothetical protein
MPSLRYLNVTLTVIAVLLGLHLWTLWTAPVVGGAPLSAQAVAQAEAAGGIPNAAAQRKQMIELLKRLTQKTEELTGMLKSGQARVRVEQAARP